MKIKDLKSIIDQANDYNPEGRIEIAFKKKTYDLAKVSQSGVLGDLYIEIGEVIYDWSDERNS